MKSFLLALLTGAVLLPALNAQELEEPVQPAPVVPPAAFEPSTNGVTPGPVRRSRSSSSHRDIVAVGNDAVLREGEACHDLVVVGGSALVDGTVNGDFVVVLGKAKLGPTAVLKRDLTVVAGTFDVAPEAQINGERIVVGTWEHLSFPTWFKFPADWVRSGLLLGRPLPHQFWWSWALAGLFLVLYLLLAVLFPQPLQASVQTLQSRPGNAFLTGLLAMVLIGPLFLFLAVSVIGLVLVPFVLCGFVAAFVFGKVAVYCYAGQQVGSHTHLDFLQKPLVALLVGALIFLLLYTVPVLGLIVWCVVTPLAVGATLLAFLKQLHREEPKGAVTATVPVAGLPPQGAGPAGTAEPPAFLALPRVGFWPRFGATLLDAVLVGMLLAFTEPRPGVVILVWTVYHVAMWAWKGTTIGGMVLGLKIVRTDGRPINFAVALVRALAAFLSAFAFFLGFFWAGWSAEKQSWHDKVAGTCVVKMPPGVAWF